MAAFTISTNYSHYDAHIEMNDTYYYHDVPIPDIVPNSIRLHTAALGSLLALLTFITNFIIIRYCWKLLSIRRDVFYIQIINFGITNLCVSVFVLPFTIYYILYPWQLGQVVCKLWIVFDIMIPFTSLTILLMMTIDRILAMSHPNVYNHLFQNNRTKIWLAPWISAIVIVVPLWTLGNVPHESLPGECIVVIKPENALLCHTLTFIIPLVILLSLIVKMVINMLKTRSISTDIHSSSDSIQLNNNSIDNNEAENEGDKPTHTRVPLPVNRNNKVHPSSILCVSAISVLFVSMWSPYQFVSILLTICTSHSCVPTFMTSQVVTWMGTASASVTPMIWFLDRNIRKIVRRSWGMCRERREPMRQNSLNSEETFV